MSGVKSERAVWSVGMALGIMLALLGVPSRTALADFRVNIEACKSIRRVVAPGGPVLLAAQCGQRFSSNDPFIAIVTRVRDVIQIPRVDAVLQILDPSQSVVETYRWGQDVDPSGGFEFGDVAVLPMSTNAGDLARQLSDFQKDIIQVKEGRPLRERLGTWTVKATVNRQPYSLSFTLEGP